MIDIIIPAFNEGTTVQTFIDEVDSVFNGEQYTVVVVDDGSSDGCCDSLHGKSLKVVRHSRNRGYGAALKTGILNSDGASIVTCDSDGQHRADDVQDVVRQLDTYDVVIGARDKKSYAPVLRRPGKKVLGIIANYLSETKIPDLNSGLRAFRRPVVMHMLHLMPDGFSFSTTSTLSSFKMGYDVHYHPISVRKRVGKSTVSQVRHGMQTILLIIRLIVLFNPMKVFLPASVIFFILGVAQTVLEYVWNHRVNLTTAALILFTTSILTFFFGILTDQVSALRRELSVYDRNTPEGR